MSKLLRSGTIALRRSVPKILVALGETPATTILKKRILNTKKGSAFGNTELADFCPRAEAYGSTNSMPGLCVFLGNGSGTGANSFALRCATPSWD
jgi:hypothetical protein